jgi:hypothetical protein
MEKDIHEQLAGHLSAMGMGMPHREWIQSSTMPHVSLWRIALAGSRPD